MMRVPNRAAPFFVWWESFHGQVKCLTGLGRRKVGHTTRMRFQSPAGAQLCPFTLSAQRLGAERPALARSALRDVLMPDRSSGLLYGSRPIRLSLIEDSVRMPMLLLALLIESLYLFLRERPPSVAPSNAFELPDVQRVPLKCGALNFVK
jgi:hypothetical protein